MIRRSAKFGWASVFCFLPWTALAESPLTTSPEAVLAVVERFCIPAVLADDSGQMKVLADTERLEPASVPSNVGKLRLFQRATAWKSPHSEITIVQGDTGWDGFPRANACRVTVSNILPAPLHALLKDGLLGKAASFTQTATVEADGRRFDSYQREKPGESLSVVIRSGSSPEVTVDVVRMRNGPAK